MDQLRGKHPREPPPTAVTARLKKLSAWLAADFESSDPIPVEIIDLLISLIRERHPHAPEMLSAYAVSVEDHRFVLWWCPLWNHRRALSLSRIGPNRTGALGAFSSAARQAVFLQTAVAKADLLTADPRCALTGEAVTTDTCDLDHAPPWTFAMIVRSYLDARGLDPANVAYALHADYDVSLLPAALAADFAEYHRERAVLRLLLRALNRGGAFGYGGGWGRRRR
jgi:hypothetical protein